MVVETTPSARTRRARRKTSGHDHHTTSSYGNSPHVMSSVHSSQSSRTRSLPALASRSRARIIIITNNHYQTSFHGSGLHVVSSVPPLKVHERRNLPALASRSRARWLLFIIHHRHNRLSISHTDPGHLRFLPGQRTLASFSRSRCQLESQGRHRR